MHEVEDWENVFTLPNLNYILEIYGYSKLTPKRNNYCENIIILYVIDILNIL